MRIIPVAPTREKEDGAQDDRPANHILAVRSGVLEGAGNSVCKLIVLKLLF